MHMKNSNNKQKDLITNSKIQIYQFVLQSTLSFSKRIICCSWSNTRTCLIHHNTRNWNWNWNDFFLFIIFVESFSRRWRYFNNDSLLMALKSQLNILKSLYFFLSLSTASKHFFFFYFEFHFGFKWNNGYYFTIA